MTVCYIYDCKYPCVSRISGARAAGEEASLVATELFPEPIFPNQRHQVLSEDTPRDWTKNKF